MSPFPGAVGSFWNVQPCFPAVVQGPRRPRRPGPTRRARLLHGDEQRGDRGGGGTDGGLRALVFLLLLRPVRGKRDGDTVSQDILVFHALACAPGSLGTGETEHGDAARHTQHFPATVIGQTLKPATDGLGIAVCGEVVHKEEVETGLGSKDRGGTLGFLGLLDLLVL